MGLCLDVIGINVIRGVGHEVVGADRIRVPFGRLRNGCSHHGDIPQPYCFRRHSTGLEQFLLERGDLRALLQLPPTLLVDVQSLPGPIWSCRQCKCFKFVYVGSRRDNPVINLKATGQIICYEFRHEK